MGIQGTLRCTLSVALAMWLAGWGIVRAEDPALDLETARAAIQRGIPLLESGAAGSADQRTCFTCHNQALPVLALSEARKRGFDVDQKNLDRQLQHTWEHLQRGREAYMEGKGQGGQVITAGYALWALEAGGKPADEVTSAVTNYLLEYQKDKEHWAHPGRRPPSSGSDFTTTFVALRGLDAFGTSEQQSRIDERKQIIKAWLLHRQPVETEDQVFRLWALQYAGADELLSKSVEQLLSAQRDDGGWAQKDDMQSDAYATGSVLVALLTAGGVPADDAAVRRGAAYLLANQCDDGSWHVVTRAEPFQTYYESGFPHGADQFISISASSWAIWALLLACEFEMNATPAP